MSYYTFTAEQYHRHPVLTNSTGPYTSQQLRNILEEAGLLVKANKESITCADLNLQERLEHAVARINTFALDEKGFAVALTLKAQDDANKAFFTDPTEKNRGKMIAANIQHRRAIAASAKEKHQQFVAAMNAGS